MKPQESAKILHESGLFKGLGGYHCWHVDSDGATMFGLTCDPGSVVGIELTINQADTILGECGLQVVWREYFGHYCFFEEKEDRYSFWGVGEFANIPKGQIAAALHAAVAWVCQQPKYAEQLKRGIEKARKL